VSPIIKSPIVIGTTLKDSNTSISAESLTILKNTDVVMYNQDSLGAATNFQRRWTEEGYEVLAGPLSGGKAVPTNINLFDKPQLLTLDPPDVEFQSAKVVEDI
jgi:alpha-galactosidase